MKINWFKEKKEKKQFSKMISVYFSKDYKRILIAPFFIDEAWVYYEQDDVESLDLDVDDKLLGEALKRNLNKFDKRETDLRRQNLTDWPSFKASGLKTVKEFEKKYFRISVSGLNEANIILAMDAEMKSKYEIDLRTTISAFAEDDQLGLRLRILHKAQIERKIE